MPQEKIIKKILKYLSEQPGGGADSVNIIEDLSLEISNHEYDKLIKEMNYRGLLEMVHEQKMSSSAPDYDRIWISEKGKEYL